MGRTKVPPIQTQQYTSISNIEKGVGSSESQETSSSSFTSISTTSTSTCPNCRNCFPDLSEKDLRHHVASCSRPSTADTTESITTSGSSLSPPPASPSIAMDPSKKLSIGSEAKSDLHFDYNAAQAPNLTTADGHESDSDDNDFIRPYLDPTSEFDYYDQIEGHEDVVVESNDPDFGLKFRYPKLPPISHFEQFLKNPHEMSYETLYHRTALISTNVLAAWQQEFDAIDEEIYAHELQEKERLQIEKEAEKATEEAEKLAAQQEKDELASMANQWNAELKSNDEDWGAWMEQFDEHDVFRQRLEKLRDPQFRAKLQKQEAAREQEKLKLLQKELKELNKPKLINEPLPEYKQSKEEIEAEKRKLGRFMDPIKWDDMKQADLYGFEYSAHIKHLGAQPLPSSSRKRGFGEIDLGESRSGRAQRMVTRKMYDQSTPEDESDALPAKRQRKTRVLDENAESSKPSRKQSRSQTPMRRTFPSGKPIGRPPKTLSKLKDVQLASGVEAGEEDVGHKDEETSQQLLPAEEEQLQQSAELLVNQIADEGPAEPIVKKKHAGGRPRKHPLPATKASAPANEAIARKPETLAGAPGVVPSKSTNDSGLIVNPAKKNANESGKSGKKSNNPPKSRSRPVKKNPVVEPGTETEEENGVLPTTEQDDDSQATEAVVSRPGSSSSQETVSSFGTQRNFRASTREKTLMREARASARKRPAATIQEEPFAIEESPRKRAKRTRGSSEMAPAVLPASSPAKSRKSRAKNGVINEEEEKLIIEPTIKQEATPAVEHIISPPSSRNKRKRPECVVETPIPVPSPVKSARKGRPVKASSTPVIESVVRAKPPTKLIINRKAKGPLAKLLPPREPSTRARRPPKPIGDLDGADDDEEEEEDEDELNMPATEYERYQALTSPKSPVQLGKRVRKNVMDLKSAMLDGDDEDGDDEFEEY